MKGDPELELNDLLRIAGIGLVIGFLHVFFEQTGKKEFSFFLFFVAYIYIAAEMLRFLRIFFSEIAEFFQWLSLAF
jgi:stage III sporulation protein AC